MGLKFIYCFLLCFFVIEAINFVRATEDDDTVIVEAEPSKESKRKSRQLFLQGPALPLHAYAPFLANDYKDDWASVPLTTTPCITSKGALGKCTGFRQCYPYFKLPELNNWDSWVLGMYDTCSYYTAQGRQMFGVCCTNPVTSNEPEPLQTTEPISVTEPPLAVEPVVLEPEDFPQNITESEVKVPNYQVISNWPPPIPTHPPDHTIPPLPTHPPSPGYPVPVTESSSAWPPVQTEKPTYKPIYKPTRPSKPPTRPSKPPTKPTTTTESPIATGACGAKNGFQDQERIVGGHNADVNEWPWIAALFNSGRQFCGGSLIDDIHILSAAHCVAHMSSWDVARLTVRLGDHNIKTQSETRHVEKKVRRVVRHRGFDPRTLYNDIAILTLDSPVDFTRNIRPVCLPGAGRDFAGQTGTVIGWGSLRESGPQPAVLQEVSIPIWSNSDCRQKYGHAAPGGIVEHMLCAGQASRDSCSGDSGGPLMVNSGRWTQAGIVSWGIGCGKGQYPGVYTRVEKFMPWITKNLKK
ncbi:unnamed protein product [Brassicogethes aeneus]|uniref:Phenoloxidase-activating factor 2 n=1 Tax=Brassicogethes aeneus TaxID=1431903 RepID=A0A9P0BFC0_BRAAE|nr:unnamed protein product [Brassicogethes aeneus]